jgi:hypothetical protein
MGADGGIEHGPAAAGADHAKIPRPLGNGTGQAENKSDADSYSEFHGFSG